MVAHGPRRQNARFPKQQPDYEVKIVAIISRLKFMKESKRTDLDLRS